MFLAYGSISDYTVWFSSASPVSLRVVIKRFWPLNPSRRSICCTRIRVSSSVSHQLFSTLFRFFIFTRSIVIAQEWGQRSLYLPLFLFPLHLLSFKLLLLFSSPWLGTLPRNLPPFLKDFVLVQREEQLRQRANACATTSTKTDVKEKGVSSRWCFRGITLVARIANASQNRIK